MKSGTLYRFFYYICFMKRLWYFIKGILGFPTKVAETITKVEKVKNPTQLELYQQFGEEVLIDCGIDLRNVLIKPAYDNKSGVTFNYKSFDDFKVAYTLKKLRKQPYNYSNILFYDETYMVLPEIVDLQTLCVWIHEIGHYMMHFGDKRPDFIIEYEAEMYVKAIVALCPIEKPEPHYTKNYPLLYHQIHLTYYMKSAQEYVKSFINSEKDWFKVRSYMNDNIQSFIDQQIEYPTI